MAYVFYTGDLSAGASTPWITDGTAAGTRELTLADLGLRSDSALQLDDSRIMEVGAHLLFTGTNASGASGVFTASPAGHEQLLIPQGERGGARTFHNGSQTFILTNYGSGTARQSGIWITDLTPQGTTQLSTLYANVSMMAGDKLLFGVFQTGGFTDVWMSDGTVAGTQKLRTVWTSSTFRFERGNGSVIFSGEDVEADPVLGTSVRTGQQNTWVIEGAPRSDVSIPSFDFVVNGETLFVSGADRNELWITDNATGISRLVHSAPFSCELKQVVDGIAYFTVAEIANSYSGNARVDLWATDGQTAWLVMDLPPDNITWFLRQPLNIVPSSLFLSDSAVSEHSASGTIVGTLSANDFESTNTLVYTLRGNANGRFAIQGDKLVVADGTLLDFEQKTSHTVTVRATDQGGKFTDKTFTIAVSNVATETVNGDIRANKIAGGSNDDELSGGGGNDTMWGGGGNDRIFGGEGADVLDGGSGDDAISGGAGDDTIAGLDGGDHLFGGDGADTLNGGESADRLDGGTGADTLIGGNGSDYYWITAGDSIVEVAGTGRADRVYVSHISLNLSTFAGGFIEQAVLSGGSAFNLTGNAAANALWGNGAANVLNGKQGIDYLSGGGGNDKFVFDTKLATQNVDRISDFARGDRICLDNAIFTKLGAAGALKADFFRPHRADDRNDYIHYDQATGALFYDADGNGRGPGIKFAVVETKLALTAADFLVI